ncbi:hypothetical protein BDZ97DRAFT_1915691 [Flammula alnicola]|nr:hypothetical protein BDZ97DRAFT_1915691 [Flammula alnicola]
MPPFQVFEFAFACCSIAAVALLAWDHIITLHAEVSKMWLKKFSGTTVLYALLRYGTLVEKIAVMLLASWYMTPRDSRLQHILLSESLRAHGKSVASGLIRVPPMLALVNHSLSTVFLLLSSQHPLTQRTICSATVRIAGIIADLLSEMIVIIVTLRKTFHLRGNLPLDDERKLPSVSGLLLQGGTIYFVALMILSLADMLVLVFDHVPQSVVGYDYWVVPYYTPVFRTIIICRFLLMLRSIFLGEEDDDSEKSRSGSLQFSSRVVGNLGAPIEFNPIRFADGGSGDEQDEEDEDIVYSRDPFTAGMMAAGSSTGIDTAQGREGV